MPAEGGQRIAAARMRLGAVFVDPDGRVVRPEGLGVPAEGEERPALAGKRVGRQGRIPHCITLSDHALAALARIPGAARQQGRAGLCTVHHDQSLRAVRKHRPHEFLGIAVGCRHVRLRIVSTVHDRVAPDQDAAHGGQQALFERAAKAAPVKDGEEAVDRGDVLAGRGDPPPARTPRRIEGCAPHDQLNRVVVRAGVQVRLQQVPADLLDHRRDADDHQVLVVPVGAA